MLNTTRNREFYHVLQPTPNGCVAACAAMAVGDRDTKPFMKFIGHTGTEARWFEAQQAALKGFTLIECARYLLHNRILMGMGAVFPEGANFHEFELIRFGFQLKDVEAIISVRSFTAQGHAVYWDGKRVWNPSSKWENNDINDYDILDIWPLTRMEDDQF